MWTALIAASVGCYLVKLAGLSIPHRVLSEPRVARVASLLPIALLAALVATATFTHGTRVAIDARAAGLAAGIVCVLLRAPFLVVVGVAAATASLLRLVI